MPYGEDTCGCSGQKSEQSGQLASTAQRESDPSGGPVPSPQVNLAEAEWSRKVLSPASPAKGADSEANMLF